MISNAVIRAAVVGAVAVLLSSGVAQADPATPMTAIESAAVQLCGAINGDPTADGVVDGLNNLQGRGFDEIDGALVLIIAVHHVCPRHEALTMGTMEPIAAEGLCTEPS